jgi:hypothetical protein
MVRDPFCVDSRFICQLIDLLGLANIRLLDLSRVGSSVLSLYFPLGLIHLDSPGQFYVPSFLFYFFLFLNNIYEHLTKVGLEWGVNFVGTSSIPYTC